MSSRLASMAGCDCFRCFRSSQAVAVFRPVAQYGRRVLGLPKFPLARPRSSEDRAVAFGAPDTVMRPATLRGYALKAGFQKEAARPILRAAPEAQRQPPPVQRQVSFPPSRSAVGGALQIIEGFSHAEVRGFTMHAVQ